MLKKITIGTSAVIMMSLAIPAAACDFHGGGFGAFGIPGATWTPYEPQAYTEDPALSEQNKDAALVTPRPTAKARPSFSNAANRAASIAKSRVAKKTKDQALEPSKGDLVKKASLNADR